ncbi:MAG: hypothetical protein U5S82_16085 [Gammaproteobacteria bacterium]|nr:hypothetical protein [Gammaproteobacteria bacterium]
MANSGAVPRGVVGDHGLFYPPRPSAHSVFFTVTVTVTVTAVVR